MNSDIRYFAIDGPESAGKTTLFNGLKAALRDTSTVFLPEIPLDLAAHYDVGTGGSEEFEVALMSAYVERLGSISDYLMSGQIVVTDGSWLSSYAYARARKDLRPSFRFDPELHLMQARVFARMFPAAINVMAMLFVTVPADVSFARLFEKLKREPEPGHSPDERWSQAVAKGFQAAIDSMRAEFPSIRVVTIDGTAGMKDVLNQALSHICRNETR